jgi:hypothetical protein
VAQGAGGKARPQIVITPDVIDITKQKIKLEEFWAIERSYKVRETTREKKSTMGELQQILRANLSRNQACQVRNTGVIDNDNGPQTPNLPQCAQFVLSRDGHSSFRGGWCSQIHQDVSESSGPAIGTVGTSESISNHQRRNNS